MLKLYSHPFSIVPWRVRIALQEKGLNYESVVTDLYTKEPEQRFLDLNPFAQIPALDDDAFIICCQSIHNRGRPRGNLCDWLVGSYSLADVCYAPLLDRVELGDEITARTALHRWWIV